MKQALSLFLAIVLFGSANAQAYKKSSVPTREEKLNEMYCKGLFRTNEAHYFDMEEDPAAFSVKGYFNILDWLQGRVAGLQVYTTPALVRIPYLRNMPASVFVDEIPRTYDFLNMLPVADIAMIKVISGPFIGNIGNASGAILIYTAGTDDGEGE